VYNLLFNIILPVIILNQVTKRFGENGPLIALLAALFFPVAYGIYDYLSRKKKNILSILGVVNVLFTGGLALLKLQGQWFAIKEAAFPLIIGLGVLWSSFTSRPLMSFFLFENPVFRGDLLLSTLKTQQKEAAFLKHLKKSTQLLAFSFFLSSLLNYLLASYIFQNIDPSLSSLEQSSILNEQIAKMTWLSFLVIALPLMFFLAFIMWHVFKGIREISGLEWKDLIKEN
ncbi:MAG: hypothetical protein D6797_00765, partial [Bdellovibrio sp.]